MGIYEREAISIGKQYHEFGMRFTIGVGLWYPQNQRTFALDKSRAKSGGASAKSELTASSACTDFVTVKIFIF